jgi:hypothetical protein
MRPSILAQCPEGRCIRPNIRGNSGNCSWWWLKGGPHMARTTELGVTKASFMC